MDGITMAIGALTLLAALNAGEERKGDGSVAGKAVNYGVNTPFRQQLFALAMKAKKTPEAYEALADEYEKAGLSAQAKALRARAASRRVSQDTIEARREVLRKAFASKDPNAVLDVAKACDQLGYTDAAERLRSYAQGLTDVASAQKV